MSFNANNIRNIAYEHCTMYIICNYNSSAIGCSWTPGSLPAFYLLYNSLAPLPLLGQVGEVSQTIRQRFVCTLKLLRLLQSNQPALSGILPNWSNKNWVHMSMTCQYTAQTSWFQLYFLLLRDLQQFCGCTVCLLAAMHVLKLLCCTNNSSRCVFKF